MFGGGQERGLRPGTLPVPLIGRARAGRRAAAVESTSAARRAVPGLPRSRCSPGWRRSARSSTATSARLGALHPQPLVSRARRRDRHRRVERSRRDLEWRRVHVADATPAATCLSAMRLPAVAAGRRRAVLVGARLAEPDWRSAGRGASSRCRASRGRRRQRRERRARDETVYYRRVAVHDASAARPSLLAGALLAARGGARRVARRLHPIRHPHARRHRRVRASRRARDAPSTSATRSARSKGSKR